MQQVPGPRPGTELRGANSIQAIMQEDHGHAQRGQPAHRHINQCRHSKHANTKDPENQKQNKEAQRKIEVISKPHHRQFQRNKPEPACPQKARELASGPAAPVEIHSHACGKHEHRQTIMGNPARKEKDRRGPREVGWRK